MNDHQSYLQLPFGFIARLLEPAPVSGRVHGFETRSSTIFFSCFNLIHSCFSCVHNLDDYLWHYSLDLQLKSYFKFLTKG